MLHDETWPDEVALALAACYRVARARARAREEQRRLLKAGAAAVECDAPTAGDAEALRPEHASEVDP